MSQKDGTDNQPASPKRRRFLKWAAGAGLIGLGGVGLDQRGEADALQVTRHDISLPAWPVGTPPLRMGQLSDLHCDGNAAVRRTCRAVEMLLAEKPDIVFLTGDYVTYKPHRWAPRVADALAPLAAVPGGVFCVMGNHDWWCGGHEIVPHALRQVGFTVLRNEAAPLPQAPGVWVVGLEDRCVNRQNPHRACRDVPPDVCRLLLMHEPDYADESPPGFALQLSGHSHGGQIRIPGVPAFHCPKYGRHYPEGLRQGPHHPVYTSRGVGMIGPPVRLFCPPEVTMLTLCSPQSPEISARL